MSDYGSSQSVSRDTPKDLDAERSFLGALIQDGTLLSKVSETVGALNEEEFISNKNRLIYKTILQRSASSDDFNRTVLCDMLETDGNLDKAGGYSYIASLITGISLPTSAVIEFAQIIRNKARRRAMIELSEDIINMCYEPNGLSVKEIYDKAAGSIFELVENSNNNTEGPKPVVAQAVELLEKIQKDMRNPNMMSGVPSGFAKLDAITQGLQPGSLNIIAARPSVGKTSFAMNIVANIAMNPDVTKPALVFSLEMPTEQILLRLLSTFGRISMNDLRAGKVNNTHWSDIIRKLKMLTMVLPQDRYMDKLYIDDSSDLTPLELRSRARKLANEYGGINMCYEPNGLSVKEIYDKAAGSIFELVENSNNNTEGPKPVVAQAVELLEKIQKDMRNPNMMSGVPSGFAKLDAITQGLQPGSLNIIAARPSVGKTSFAMNIVANIAMNPDVTKPALVFSLEMPTEQILLRLLSTFGRISMNDLRAGKVNNTHWSDIIRKLKMLTMVLPQDRYMDKLYIDDSSDLTPLELRSRARKLANEYGGLSVIMIDYVQLMRAQSKAANRTLEIAEISRSLKMLAKELKVPVLALAQLNREVDNRKDHRPLNSDLRESGSLEQDADMIMFLKREAIYGPDPSGHDNSNEATLIIGKNRNGAIEDIDLHFIGEYTAFYDKGYAEANFDNVAPVPTSDVIAYS